MTGLAEWLGDREVLLADGATGTTLFGMGLEAGEAPEVWNEAEPERIVELHAGFVAAGADLVLTNSFGANRFRLALHGREADAAALARAGAGIARRVADGAGRRVLVAGSMGPTGRILEPAGDLSHAAAVDAYVEQARGLLAGGADLLWGETLSSREEVAALAEAAGRINAPWAVTLSFDTAGRTMMGLAAGEFRHLAETLPHPPLAIGANCGTGAPDLLATLRQLRAPAGLPMVAKANAGVPHLAGGQVVYDGTPELMGRYACLARDLGARVVGGCCGTTPAHLAAMRRALDSEPRRPPPDEAAIVAATGAFTQARPDAERRRPASRRRRGGRPARGGG